MSNKKYVKASKVVKLDGLPELLTIDEAATAIGMSGDFVIRMIRAGKIKAMRPFGATRAGPGMGYRIKTADLRAWYLGESQT